MDLKVIARLAGNDKDDGALSITMSTARRAATPEQLVELKCIERQNRSRLAIVRNEGTFDFEGRIREAMRVVEALYSVKNGKTTIAARTRQSIKKHGPVEALRRIVAKKDSPGLRVLADYNRLDCAFEQIVLDFPKIFEEGDTLSIAAETLLREQRAKAGYAVPNP